MKIEGSASGEEKRSRKDMGAIRTAEKVIRKKGGGGGRSCHRKPRRRVEATSTAIQTLFAVSKAVFKGPGTVPAPADVQMLQQLLDKMKPEDVDLSADLPFFRAHKTAGRATPRISYTTIYQCKNFSMCIFFLPPTAVIPLHNHPGMTVFSKLLLGSMRIKSYDFVDPAATSISSPPSSQDRLARLVVNSDFTAPCDTSVLYPTTGGNIHTFTAITPCAVLDILGPPYSNQDGRDITYYRDHPCLSSSDGGGAGVGAGGADGQYEYGWLEEIDVPDEATMDPIAYLGPQIIDI